MGPKIFMLVWWCYHLLYGSLVNGHSRRVLRKLHILDDMGDEINPGAVYRSSDITSARRLCEGCATSHNLKWDHLSPDELCRISEREIYIYIYNVYIRLRFTSIFTWIDSYLNFYEYYQKIRKLYFQNKTNLTLLINVSKPFVKKGNF